MSRLITPLRSALALLLLVLSVCGTTNAQRGYNNGNGYGYNNGNSGGSYQEFYDELSPYGNWMNDPDYGYVWVPDAGSDFRPYYSNGYWANTDYGNTWVSNYAWGWAPFHYGRWTFNNYYGWVWIPGNTWGPAWVSWRNGGGNYGWAPLGPGISINIAIGNYNVPDYWWTFTPQRYILSPTFQNYCYRPRYNNTYVRNTTIINNTYVYNNNTYITGPRREDLQRATGRPVERVAINTANRPGRADVRGNSLALYRPEIRESAPRTSERPRQFRTAEQPIGRMGVTDGSNRERGLTPDNRTDRSFARERAERGSTDGRSAEQTRDVFNNRPDRGVQQRAEQAIPPRTDRISGAEDRAAQQQQAAEAQHVQQMRFAENQRLQQQQRDESARAQQQRNVQQEQQRAGQQAEQQRASQWRNQQVQIEQEREQQRAAQHSRAQMQQEAERRQATQLQAEQSRVIQQRTERMQPQRSEAQMAPARTAPQREEASPATRQERIGGDAGRRPFGR